MTPEQLEAERVEFHKRFPLPESGLFIELHIRGRQQDSWYARAESAHAREAELIAEIERLRERVREFAGLEWRARMGGAG